MNRMNWFLYIIINISFLLIQTLPLCAADGDLDSTFGAPNGFVITPVLGANGVYIQVDGNIVTVAGTGSPDTFFVTRYLTSGTLDGSFGVAGIATISLAALSVISVDANKIAISSDGKIAIVGTLNGGTMFVARLTATGSLDATFNPSGTLPGVVIIPQFFPGSSDQGNAIVVDIDGKIVIAGSTHFLSNQKMAVARLNSDGTLDTSFNGTGQQTVNFVTGSQDVAFAVALASDGKTIIAAGASTPPVPDSNPLIFFPFTFSFTKINPNGSIAFTQVAPFAINPLDLGDIFAQAFDVLVQPNSSIVLIGQTDWIDGNTYFALARFDSLGNLDPAFSSAPPSISLNPGTFISPTVGNDTDSEDSLAFFGALQSDGKVIAVGGGPNAFVDEVFLTNIMLARYSGLNGDIDTTFNGGGAPAGFVWTSTGNQANAVSLQGNGDIVIAGITADNLEQIVARYLVDSPATPLVATSIAFPTPGQAIPPLFTFTGFAQSPSIVDLFVDGILIGSTVTQDPSNNWSFTNTTPLGLGSHTLLVVGRYRDDGHVNLEASTTFIVCVGPVVSNTGLKTCSNTLTGDLNNLVQGGNGPFTFTGPISGVSCPGASVIVNPSGLFSFNISSTGFTGPCNFVFQATDVLGCNGTGSVTVLPNAAPKVNNLSLATCFETPLADTLASSVVGGTPPFTFTQIGPVINGSLLLRNNGNFIFTPASGVVGAGSFQFQVTDSNVTPCSSNIGTVSVAIENCCPIPSPTGLFALFNNSIPV